MSKLDKMNYMGSRPPKVDDIIVNVEMTASRIHKIGARVQDMPYKVALVWDDGTFICDRLGAFAHSKTYEITPVDPDECNSVFTLESEADIAVKWLAKNYRHAELQNQRTIVRKAKIRLNELLATTVEDYIGREP